MNSGKFQFPTIQDFKSVGWHSLMIGIAAFLTAIAQNLHITTNIATISPLLTPYESILDMGLTYIVINVINKWIADNRPKQDILIITDKTGKV